MAPTDTVDRPMLHLVAMGGRGVSGPAHEVRPLTDRQAFKALIEHVVDLRSRMDAASPGRHALGRLLVELERSAAREAALAEASTLA